MSISFFANRLAAARLDLEVAEFDHAASKAEADRLRQLADDARARQTAITTRRLAGSSTEAEASEYAALVGDIEVLNQLHAEAQALADSLAPHEARAAVRQAERDLEECAGQIQHDTLMARCREIEAAFVNCLREAHRSGKARGARTAGDAFQLCPELAQTARFGRFLPGA